MDVELLYWAIGMALAFIGLKLAVWLTPRRLDPVVPDRQPSPAHHSRRGAPCGAPSRTAESGLDAEHGLCAAGQRETARVGPPPGESTRRGGDQTLADVRSKLQLSLRGRYFSCPDTGRLIRERAAGDGRWRVRLDLTPQVLSLSIPDDAAWGSRRWRFPTNPAYSLFGSAADEYGPRSLPAAAPGLEDLLPTCPHSGFVSASMLAVKAKLFDDGLCAAVEMASQPGKATLLAALVDVATPISAAACLGGMDVPLSAAAQRLTRKFLADELSSKPLGFYSWSDSLRRIFRQDRLLQRELSSSDARMLAAALGADPVLSRAYADQLDFTAKLTNPPPARMRDLRRPGGTRFFPPSRSHEGDIAEMLFGDRPVPDGFSLAAEMIRRLRDGSLRVDPTDTSGWYDLQTWALEALVRLDKTSEGARLVTDSRYREQLEELFKALLALSRETHVKQLEVCTIGSSLPTLEGVWVDPELTVEPVRTYYERRARGYEFVRAVLESRSSLAEMHRVTAEGPVRPSLDEELADITAVFRGAAAVTGQELGMGPATETETRRFREWAKSPDIDADLRMMVPVSYDVERRKTKVWAILGWETRPLVVSFATPPAVEVLEGGVKITFGSDHRRIAYPVSAETYVSRVLDRDEFREHCDRHKTRADILRHLH